MQFCNQEIKIMIHIDAPVTHINGNAMYYCQQEQWRLANYAVLETKLKKRDEEVKYYKSRLKEKEEEYDDLVDRYNTMRVELVSSFIAFVFTTLHQCAGHSSPVEYLTGKNCSLLIPGDIWMIAGIT